SIRDRLPQIELAIGEDADDPVDALVLRILAPLSATDEDELAAFAVRHRVELYVQPQGPASVRPLEPPGRGLTYSLPDFGLTFEFEPTDFTQVNAGLNRVLVRRSIRRVRARLRSSKRCRTSVCRGLSTSRAIQPHWLATRPYWCTSAALRLPPPA